MTDQLFVSPTAVPNAMLPAQPVGDPEVVPPDPAPPTRPDPTNPDPHDPGQPDPKGPELPPVSPHTPELPAPHSFGTLPAYSAR